MSDPLSAAINAAVTSALEAQIPSIAEQVASKLAKPQKAAGLDEFVRLRDVCALLKIHKTTAHRMVLKGELPPIEHLGKKAGYRRSTLDSIMRCIGATEQVARVPRRKSANDTGARR